MINRLICAAIAVVGLGLLVGGYFKYSSTGEFLDKAVAASGTVVNIERRETRDDDGDLEYLYYPTIEYETKAGDAFQFTGSGNQDAPAYSKGAIVDILYSKAKPGIAKVNSFFAIWGAAMILGIVGLAFLLAGSAGAITGKGKFKFASGGGDADDD